MAKVEPTLTYGGEVVLGGAGFDAALAEALARVEETGATFVHAFEDEHVIAGQGTIGLELAEQVPGRRDRADPGRRRRARRRRSRSRCARCAPTSGSSASRSGATATRSPTASPSSSPGELTMGDPRAQRSTTSSRSTTSRSARRSRCCSSARSCSSRARARSGSRRSSPARSAGSGSVCAVLSGGNIDPTTLISVLRHGMTLAGRYLVMRTRLVDRPGELIKLLQLVAAERGNIVQIEHRREGVHARGRRHGRRPDRA